MRDFASAMLPCPKFHSLKIFVRANLSPGRKSGSCTSGMAGFKASSMRVRRKFFEIDFDGADSSLSGILGFGGDDGDGFAEELGLVHCQKRPVHHRGTKTRHGLRQIRGGDDSVNAFHLQGVGDIDRVDASMTAVQMN